MNSLLNELMENHIQIFRQKKAFSCSKKSSFILTFSWKVTRVKESGSYIKQIRQVSCRSYITRYFFNPIWQEFILSIHLETEKNDLQINLKKTICNWKWSDKKWFMFDSWQFLTSRLKPNKDIRNILGGFHPQNYD